MAIVKRRTVEQWLSSNGFAKVPRGANGHVCYERSGVKITLVAHGRDTVGKPVLASLLRALDKLGFDRETVRKELGMLDE